MSKTSGLVKTGLPKEYRLLCEAFDDLPGIGVQAAERLAEWLIHHGRSKELAETLMTISELGICSFCNRLKQPAGCLCVAGDAGGVDHNYFLVAATESDVRVAESCGYAGPVFVLHGELSPSRNIGPSQLKIERLQLRLEKRPGTILLLLTGQSVEGRATAEYILRRTGLDGEHLSPDQLAGIIVSKQSG